MTPMERFRMYLDKKNITNAQAERECEFSNGFIGNAIKAKTAIGSDKLEKILKVYPDLSAEWLMRGIGDMFVGGGMSPEQVFRALNMPSNSDKIIEVWLQFMDVTKGMQELYKQSRVVTD